MKYNPARDSQFRDLARERIEEGDLFTFPVAVVPIKTHGRVYGTISQAADGKVPFPHLALCCAEYVEVSSDKAFIFVALWNDSNEYTRPDIYSCTKACIKQASLRGVAQVAFPLLGGNRRHEFIGAMEQAVDDAMEETSERDEHMPDVVFVTDKELL